MEYLFSSVCATVDNALVQAGDWGRAEGSRGREVGGAEAGLRAGLQHSLAHTVATQLAQVPGTARRQVKVDREKVSSAARSLRTLIKSNWRNSAKSKETSTKSKVRSGALILDPLVLLLTFQNKVSPGGDCEDQVPEEVASIIEDYLTQSQRPHCHDVDSPGTWIQPNIQIGEQT